MTSPSSTSAPTSALPVPWSTRYLMEQDLAIPERVATCLFYGIETELNAYPREADIWTTMRWRFLYPARPTRTSWPRFATRRCRKAYFECILQALQSSFLYDRLIISWVNELAQPEFTAQVTDFLVRHEDVDWAVCAGIHEDRMLLSVRTTFRGPGPAIFCGKS